MKRGQGDPSKVSRSTLLPLLDISDLPFFQLIVCVAIHYRERLRLLKPHPPHLEPFDFAFVDVLLPVRDTRSHQPDRLEILCFHYHHLKGVVSSAVSD